MKIPESGSGGYRFGLGGQRDALAADEGCAQGVPEVGERIDAAQRPRPPTTAA
jgi:hypothetical protein